MAPSPSTSTASPTVTLADADGRRHELPGYVVSVDADALAAATGWHLRSVGLCRGPVCVPLRDADIVAIDGGIDLVAWAEVLGAPCAFDEDHGIVALAAPPRDRGAAVGDPAPDLALPDLAGELRPFSALAGRKRLLVTWASWCGCRHELGAWQEVADELADDGLSIYSVALDGSADDVRPWVEAAEVRYPVVVDADHVTAERYDITNVPSVVWVDEEGAVAKGPTIAPGDDQFRDFTRIDAATHHDALRRWVRDGTLPAGGSHPAPDRTTDAQQARAERRLAGLLHERGDDAAAALHLARAVELAPWDWTIRRGGIAMRGDDPFLGDEFLAFWQTWDDAGRPGYTPTT